MRKGVCEAGGLLCHRMHGRKRNAGYSEVIGENLKAVGIHLQCTKELRR